MEKEPPGELLNPNWALILCMALDFLKPGTAPLWSQIQAFTSPAYLVQAWLWLHSARVHIARRAG